MSGFTTRIVSKFKPDAQIIGLSPDDAIVRQMQIYWGVRPFKSHKAETTKDLLDEATDIVLDLSLIHIFRSQRYDEVCNRKGLEYFQHSVLSQYHVHNGYQ